jgi:hypothetical protein
VVVSPDLIEMTDLIEMIEEARRQISGTQVRGSFRCVVAGPHW